LCDKASATPAATQVSASGQAQAASQVSSARDDRDPGVDPQLAACRQCHEGGVTSALTAISADLQKMKDAQPKLALGRKQQVQEAATAFDTQLKDIVRQTAPGSRRPTPRRRPRTRPRR
jgi:hypothetical protein